MKNQRQEYLLQIIAEETVETQEQLLERLEPKTGRIILVPHANQQAIELNQRTASDGVDMNRSYPGAEDGNPSG